MSKSYRTRPYNIFDLILASIMFFAVLLLVYLGLFIFLFFILPVLIIYIGIRFWLINGHIKKMLD
ncbi:hypothetical protein AUK11_00455 [bacterium CG2_30_37_16]|nr:MAG: hypothetical protein AUK11_00455 [bacterium CG2_30_37_16]PIP30390.1 MAG: hypothetical protein COX25_04855 [bacterium (Candidatus Howlettbacteria) CG23_combo_of_CG06-09_8_20_14_all_37_9]PIX98905.1 MAG: hypothetical protein COZ22_03920 [bacterium (Candidatus Howlettbacteria) CG_4_10_14_3_um_filter_37_10]PJB05875.1 MAG: hypothetical protein CO123_03125 [bacterium (Candidatus Howlettbacteria) CG_4_9_14_3_um_filter_37_10]